MFEPPAERVLGADTGDRRCRGVPVLDDAVVVDEEDAVVHVLEHPRVPLQREALLVDAALEPAQLDRALQRCDEVVAVDRLLDEVVGAAAQGLHRQVVLAVPGDQHRRRLRAQLLDLAQHLEAVEAGHLDVADDGVVVGLADPI